MNHTKGPWKPHFDNKYSAQVRTTEPGVLIGLVSGSVGSEYEANAHLIAAAPELLEALTQLIEATLNVQATREIRDALKVAMAAIDKANGAA